MFRLSLPDLVMSGRQELQDAISAGARPSAFQQGVQPFQPQQQPPQIPMMPQQMGMMPQQMGMMPQQMGMMPQQIGMMPPQIPMMPPQIGMMPMAPQPFAEGGFVTRPDPFSVRT